MTERPWLAVDYWPRPLWGLVAEYGGGVVAEAGLELFGFPVEAFGLVKDEPARLAQYLKAKGA